VIEEDRGGFNVPSIATYSEERADRTWTRTWWSSARWFRRTYKEFVAAVQIIDRVEDRNAKLRRDIENSQEVLVEAMGGSDFPRMELEAKARTAIDALQGKRMHEKERHEASIRKMNKTDYWRKHAKQPTDARNRLRD